MTTINQARKSLESKVAAEAAEREKAATEPLINSIVGVRGIIERLHTSATSTMANLNSQIAILEGGLSLIDSNADAELTKDQAKAILDQLNVVRENYFTALKKTMSAVRPTPSPELNALLSDVANAIIGDVDAGDDDEVPCTCGMCDVIDEVTADEAASQEDAAEEAIRASLSSELGIDPANIKMVRVNSQAELREMISKLSAGRRASLN